MGLDIDQHYEKIYKYCYFRLHSRDLAEDITQETFLRFFTSDTYRDTGQALQYLYTVACGGIYWKNYLPKYKYATTLE